MKNRLFALLSLASLAQAFVVHQGQQQQHASTLFMAPRFDAAADKWVATSPAEEPSAGYGIGKTLLLRGPKPFLHRLLQPDDYEQAVLKFMAGDGVSRIEAHGNMDAYLENPNDWAYQRFEDKKRGITRDYTTIKGPQLALTAIWGSFVVLAIARAAYSLTTGDYFWGFLPGF